VFQGVSCPLSEVVSGSSCRNVTVAATDGAPVHITSNPHRANTSGRVLVDAFRPPVQPRTSAPVHGLSLCLPDGLTTVGVSRSSSCEVLIDDADDARLSDVVSRRSAVVSRRSSCASSSAADDGNSTDGSAAWFDLEDVVVPDSLLDRLLMRLRQSPPNCARRPSFQTSDNDEEVETERYHVTGSHVMSRVTRKHWRELSSPSCARRSSFQTSSLASDDDEERETARDHVTGNYHLTGCHVASCVTRKHCSLLSSLDDIDTDSDFELCSSLSQLVMTPGKTPRQPTTSYNHDVVPRASASSPDLQLFGEDQLEKCPDLLELRASSVAAADTPVGGELGSANSSGLSAPITLSLPAEIHIAKTSRVLTRLQWTDSNYICVNSFLM